MKDLVNKIELANNGDIDAMLEVAEYIVWDDQSKPIEDELLEKAIDYLNKGIAQDNSNAMLSLGAMYYVGRGVKQNFAEALRLYTDSANLGNISAISNLGYCYYYGRSVPVNLEKAYQMFSKSAMLGDPISLYKCGDMFMSGKYVDRDHKTGFSYYVDAYNIMLDLKPLEGYPDVCARIGRCLHEGSGTDKNLVEAEKFLREAKIYFKKKLDSGDKLSAPGGLKRSTEEWLQVCKELGI